VWSVTLGHSCLGGRVSGMKALGACALLLIGAAAPLHSQDLSPSDVRVSLDSALHLAQKAAASAFPELSDYLLHSVRPRALKGDPGGLHWQVLWQDREFPHRRRLVIRVYMQDGRTVAERGEATNVPR
jgi:hypothetical protein